MILKSEIIIFTDGSSRGNPGPGGWGSILVSLKQNEKVQDTGFTIQELGGREENTTNNRMELMAAISALSELSVIYDSKFLIKIYTDSSYLINGITKWVFGWKKNGWITKTKEEVLNRDLWEKLLNLVSDKKIEWKHVGGHVGVVGNERCDEIATDFADGKNPKLYNGPLSGYKIDILNFEKDSDMAIEKKDKKNRSNKPAFSYVSIVDGVIEIHKTWAECEKRVKGTKGAKYQKVFSETEEKELVQNWSKA